MLPSFGRYFSPWSARYRPSRPRPKGVFSPLRILFALWTTICVVNSTTVSSRNKNHEDKDSNKLLFNGFGLDQNNGKVDPSHSKWPWQFFGHPWSHTSVPWSPLFSGLFYHFLFPKGLRHHNRNENPSLVHGTLERNHKKKKTSSARKAGNQFDIHATVTKQVKTGRRNLGGFKVVDMELRVGPARNDFKSATTWRNEPKFWLGRKKHPYFSIFTFHKHAHEQERKGGPASTVESIANVAENETRKDVKVGVHRPIGQETVKYKRLGDDPTRLSVGRLDEEDSRGHKRDGNVGEDEGGRVSVVEIQAKLPETRNYIVRRTERRNLQDNDSKTRHKVRPIQRPMMMEEHSPNTVVHFGSRDKDVNGLPQSLARLEKMKSSLAEQAASWRNGDPKGETKARQNKDEQILQELQKGIDHLLANPFHIVDNLLKPVLQTMKDSSEKGKSIKGSQKSIFTELAKVLDLDILKSQLGKKEKNHIKTDFLKNYVVSELPVGMEIKTLREDKKVEPDPKHNKITVQNELESNKSRAEMTSGETLPLAPAPVKIDSKNIPEFDVKATDEEEQETHEQPKKSHPSDLERVILLDGNEMYLNDKPLRVNSTSSDATMSGKWRVDMAEPSNTSTEKGPQSHKVVVLKSHGPVSDDHLFIRHEKGDGGEKEKGEEVLAIHSREQGVHPDNPRVPSVPNRHVFPRFVIPVVVRSHSSRNRPKHNKAKSTSKGKNKDEHKNNSQRKEWTGRRQWMGRSSRANSSDTIAPLDGPRFQSSPFGMNDNYNNNNNNNNNNNEEINSDNPLLGYRFKRSDPSSSRNSSSPSLGLKTNIALGGMPGSRNLSWGVVHNELPSMDSLEKTFGSALKNYSLIYVFASNNKQKGGVSNPAKIKISKLASVTTLSPALKKTYKLRNKVPMPWLHALPMGKPENKTRSTASGYKGHTIHHTVVGVAILALFLCLILSVMCAISYGKPPARNLQRVNSRTAIFSPHDFY